MYSVFKHRKGLQIWFRLGQVSKKSAPEKLVETSGATWHGQRGWDDCPGKGGGEMVRVLICLGKCPGELS